MLQVSFEFASLSLSLFLPSLASTTDRILKMRLSSFPLCLLLRTHTHTLWERERDRETRIFFLGFYVYFRLPLLFISLSVAPFVLFICLVFVYLPLLSPLPLLPLLLCLPALRFSFEFSHIHFISCALARPSASCQPTAVPLSLTLSFSLPHLLLLSPSTCDPLSTRKCAWIMIVARFSKLFFHFSFFTFRFSLFLLLLFVAVVLLFIFGASFLDTHARAACGSRTALFPRCPSLPPPLLEKWKTASAAAAAAASWKLK